MHSKKSRWAGSSQTLEGSSDYLRCREDPVNSDNCRVDLAIYGFNSGTSCICVGGLVGALRVASSRSNCFLQGDWSRFKVGIQDIVSRCVGTRKLSANRVGGDAKPPSKTRFLLLTPSVFIIIAPLHPLCILNSLAASSSLRPPYLFYKSLFYLAYPSVALATFI